MKKKATIVSVIIGILAVAAIIVFSAYRSSESYRKAKAAIQWDCSVTCTEESTSAKYVITYSDVKVLSKTGTLTIQNKNDFDIVVHLLCEGEQEVVSDNIPANSFYSFTNVTDKEYTVGIHADVGVAADIRVVVYDGKDTEPYTKIARLAKLDKIVLAEVSIFEKTSMSMLWAFYLYCSTGRRLRVYLPRLLLGKQSIYCF